MLWWKYVHNTEMNYQLYHWKCTKRNNACTAPLKTSLDLLEPEVVGIHNHEPSQLNINIYKACVEMKDTACNNDDNPAPIFSNALEQLDDLTRAHFLSALVCKRTIRLAEFPPVPAPLRELVIERDGEWDMTREQNQCSFLSKSPIAASLLLHYQNVQVDLPNFLSGIGHNIHLGNLKYISALFLCLIFSNYFASYRLLYLNL